MKKQTIHPNVRTIIKEMEDDFLGGDGGQSSSSPSKPISGGAPVPTTPPPAEGLPAEEGADVVGALKDLIDAISSSPDGLKKLKDLLAKAGDSAAPPASSGDGTNDPAVGSDLDL